MAKKTFTLILLLPLMLFFLKNGTTLPIASNPLFEAGSEMMKCPNKVSYLLPENEIQLDSNELTQPQKYKLKDPHKFKGKRFNR